MPYGIILTKLNHKNVFPLFLISANRFDEDTNTVILDYPRNIKDFWIGIPNHIDAAFQYKDGTLFFSFLKRDE